MHLLFTRDKELPTNRVIDWLYFYNAKYNKHTGTKENTKHFSFYDKTFSICYGGLEKREVDTAGLIKDITLNSVWFRTPNHGIDDFLPNLNWNGTYPKEYLLNSIKKRIGVFWEFLGFNLSRKNHLGSFGITGLNKLSVLSKAQKHGLLIPRTLITNDKRELVTFFKKCHNQIITKPIHEIIPQYEHTISKTEQESYFQLTEFLDCLENTPNEFAPSLFQEYIDKEFEIRTVYLMGKLYSAAIFTQLNEQTKIDMRNRDTSVPTRYVPYQIPKKDKKAMKALMKELDLNFGVVDFIKSKKGHHYFLEINPNGQYGDVSMYCNYYLHKKIAEFLENGKK